MEITNYNSYNLPVKFKNRNIDLSSIACVMQQSPKDTTTNRYSFIPSTRVIDVLAAKDWFPSSVMATNSRESGHQKHLIRFRKSVDLLRPTKSEVSEIVLTNSHDAKSSFKLDLGVYRLVCSNGLMVGETYNSHRIGHTGYTDKAVEIAIEDITYQAPKMLEMVDKFKQVILSNQEQDIFRDSIIEAIYDDETRAFVVPDSIMRHRRTADAGSDLWSLTNRAQENVIKGFALTSKLNEKGRPEIRKTRAVNNIDRNVRINQAIWTMAEKMAELKA